MSKSKGEVAAPVDLQCSGFHTTVQFNAKIQHLDGKTPQLWSSKPVENYGFSDDRYSFFADNVAMNLSEDGKSYQIKSVRDEECVVNITVTQASPGFMVGEDGTSYYGTDPKAPWGSMRHRFWPRCNVEGSFLTKTGEVDFKGRGLFSHALQGMKPHHAGMDSLLGLKQCVLHGLD